MNKITGFIIAVPLLSYSVIAQEPMSEKFAQSIMNRNPKVCSNWNYVYMEPIIPNDGKGTGPFLMANVEMEMATGK